MAIITDPGDTVKHRGVCPDGEKRFLRRAGSPPPPKTPPFFLWVEAPALSGHPPWGLFLWSGLLCIVVMWD